MPRPLSLLAATAVLGLLAASGQASAGALNNRDGCGMYCRNRACGVRPGNTGTIPAPGAMGTRLLWLLRIGLLGAARGYALPLSLPVSRAHLTPIIRPGLVGTKAS
jgi:hypothetical protein